MSQRARQKSRSRRAGGPLCRSKISTSLSESSQTIWTDPLVAELGLSNGGEVSRLAHAASLAPKAHHFVDSVPAE